MSDVWNNDFAEFDCLPGEVEDDIREARYHVNNLKDVVKHFQPWAQGLEPENGTGEDLRINTHTCTYNMTDIVNKVHYI